MYCNPTSLSPSSILFRLTEEAYEGYNKIEYLICFVFVYDISDGGYLTRLDDLNTACSEPERKLEYAEIL